MMTDQTSAEKVIDIPGVGSVAFPAGMTEAEINAASTRLYKDANPQAKRPPVTSWIDTAVDWLPTAGAVAGGVLGAATGIPTLGVTSGPGAVIGAGILGAGGEAAKQLINRARGVESPATSGEAASAIGLEGAKDAAGAAIGAGVVKGAGVAVPAAARAAVGAGKALERAGGSEAAAWAARILAGTFGLKGAAGEAAGTLAAPAAARIAGRGLQAAGGAVLNRTEAAAGPAALTAAERAAQIPLRERLAQIPLQDVSEAWQAAKAAAPAVSIADDVQMVRALVAKRFTEPAALKVVAGDSKEFASHLKTGYMQSLKAKGMPIPEAALKGKVSPEVSALMETPTFKALAAHVADLPK